MPELPEVEHAASCLRRWLLGERIERVEAPASRVLRGASPAGVARRLRERRLCAVERRGKYLLLSFDGGVGILSHLGMTGKWIRRRPDESVPAHSRVRLHVDDAVVHYVDPRMFGRFTVHPLAELEQLPEVRIIGTDPLHDGRYGATLATALARTKRPVKVALMDPRVTAGIGNILATEALFRAKIHPLRPASSLRPAEIGTLSRGIRAAIRRSMQSVEQEDEISYQSDAESDNPFLVYGRAGEPCPRCRAPLGHMTLGGRTTVFCPRCQRNR